MAPLPDAARAHYLAQQALVARTSLQAQDIWATADPSALDASWGRGRIGEQLYVTTASGQLAAASRAERYLDVVLAEQDLTTSPLATVSPRSFAGVASDGRSLESLLYEPIITAKTALLHGEAIETAMQHGAAALVRIVSTQVADAGRSAVGTGIAVRPRIGWVRMLNPPSCGRCAVLAGKPFKWNAGFQRHPRCDCVHIPTAEAADELTTNPRTYFDSLNAEDQARYFTKAGAEAIRGGADIGQVVNARRGMTAAGTTIEGTTRRGFAGKRLKRSEPRLMPERIFDLADGSRERATALLYRHGYVVRG